MTPIPPNEIKTERKKSSGKVKARAIIALVLALVMAGGVFAGYKLLSRQDEEQVVDRTRGETFDHETSGSEGGNSGDGSGEDGGAPEAQAVFSESVRMFVDDDAAAANAAISDVQVSNLGIELTLSGNEGLASLGQGDLFFLDGNASTPLGEPFIGKVTGISDTPDGRVYQVETPMLDEVFDELHIDTESVLDAANVTDVQTMEGVTVRWSDNVSADIGIQGSDTVNTGAAAGDGLSVGHATADKTGNIQVSPTFTGDGKGLLFEFDIDLLKLFDQKEDDIFTDKYSYADAEEIKVYGTQTGSCYHREGCGFLYSTREMTLQEAIDRGLTPCRICRPPVINDNNFDAFVKLEGQLGLERINYSVNFDWDVHADGLPIRDLSTYCYGTFIAQADVKAGFTLEWGGEDTKVNLPFGFLKVEGLKEKLFPLAFVCFNGGTATAFDNQQIRAVTSAPLTVAAMIYVDSTGKISIQASAGFAARQSFSMNATYIRNGKWVGEKDVTFGEPETSYELITEVSADADGHFGASLLLYVFNVNVVDIALAKLGVEGEGQLRAMVSSSQTGADTNGVTATWYIKGYLKLLDVNIKLKWKIDFWIADFSGTFERNFTIKEIKLFEFGSKGGTRYKPGVMSCSQVTAKDQHAIYYRDESGALIKKDNDEIRTQVLYSDPFFSICAIDEGFIYVLKPTGNGYEIHRVSKDNGTSRRVATEVKTFLTFDEYKLYYTTTGDERTIMELDRDKLTEQGYTSFGYPVRFMAATNGGFYVVAEDDDIFAMFFGSSSYCYFVKDGSIVENYGDSPSVDHFYITNIGGKFNEAARIVTAGYLRSSASEIYWMNNSRSAWVKAECKSGWAPKDVGIFTTLDSESEEYPNQIVLYRAADGSRVHVTDVYSDQAFFTLSQAINGDWYFFDQTDEALILYKMNSSFTYKQEVKRFSLSEMPCSLTTCSMVIMDNCCYFFTMPDSSTCRVLYRYDIV